MLDLSIWEIGASMGMMFADVFLLIGVGAAIISLVLAGIDSQLSYPRMEPHRPLAAAWFAFLVCVFMAVSLIYSSQSFETVGLFIGFSFASYLILLVGFLLLLGLATAFLITSRRRRMRRTEPR